MSDNLTELQRSTVERIKAANATARGRSDAGRLGWARSREHRKLTAEMRAKLSEWGRIGAVTRNGSLTTTASRVAARYAALCRCSLAEAADVIGISASCVSRSWHRMYPGVSAVVSRRAR